VSKEGFFQLVTQFPQVGVEVMSALAFKLHHTTQALTAARARIGELDKGNGGG
jgi:CRP/FNR family transcriptional regulator, cyclic AMP receptor protein